MDDVASTRSAHAHHMAIYAPTTSNLAPFSSLVDRPKVRRSKSFTAPPSHSSFVPRLLRSAAPVPKNEATKGGEGRRGVGVSERSLGRYFVHPKLPRHSGAPIIASLSRLSGGLKRKSRPSGAAHPSFTHVNLRAGARSLPSLPSLLRPPHKYGHKVISCCGGRAQSNVLHPWKTSVTVGRKCCTQTTCLH